MAQFHKDEAHRGQHLVNPKDGRLWPWTRNFAAKGWKLADDTEEFMKRNSKEKVELNVTKLPRLKQKVVLTSEDNTPDQAFEAYKQEKSIEDYEVGSKVKVTK